MVEFIWEPVIATALMLAGAAVAYLILIATRRITAPKPSASKLKTYGCGEEVKPEETHADSKQFYSAVHRVLRPFYRYIQTAHTGVLNTYLLWVVIGFIIILAVILLTVVFKWGY